MVSALQLEDLRPLPPTEKRQDQRRNEHSGRGNGQGRSGLGEADQERRR
ncbi:MAG: hypothetical protein IIC41_07125 [Candidatus Marinimicrobia bacterium]|nr:hypothetical protein [Candidatus Neomarinimicrobiota bacterium]